MISTSHNLIHRIGRCWIDLSLNYSNDGEVIPGSWDVAASLARAGAGVDPRRIERAPN
jgi:hypothetical protein